MCNDQLKTGIMGTGAASVLLSGLVLIILGSVALQSENLDLANQMIMANTDNDDGVPVNMEYQLQCIVFYGALAVLAGAFAFVGIAQHLKLGLAFYTILAGFIACMLVSTGVNMMMTMEGIEPTIARQIDTFCNETTYEKVSAQLKCGGEEAAAGAAIACSATCEEKAAQATKLGGCKFLQHACKNPEYSFLGEGFCLLPGGVLPPMYASGPNTPISMEECLKFCTDDIQCTGIVQKGTACYVITKSGSTPATGTGWTLEQAGDSRTFPLEKASANDPGASCHKKAESKLKERLQDWSVTFSLVCIIFGSLIGVSTCCSCAYTYSVAMNRKGKPSGAGLCGQMFCPCLHSEKGPPLHDESSDGEYE